MNINFEDSKAHIFRFSFAFFVLYICILPDTSICLCENMQVINFFPLFFVNIVFVFFFFFFFFGWHVSYYNHDGMVCPWHIIRKTCPCNVYPLKPHFYIAKLGYAGVYPFFLFLLQNIDCGYSLKPPRRGGSNVSKKRKNIKKISMKFSIFTAEKILCILHGQVFVMM